MPAVSVVVPIYNVADYLEACLESIAEQSFSDLEVVLVDDGSSDDSPRIAEMFVARDPRFRLIRQPNGGLGKARNTGSDAATGEFLAFVDSDDIVARHGYEVLLAALRRTDSDFASGNFRRLSSLGTSTAFASDVFQRQRLATHISKDLSLLADRTAWNKLFRRSFWDHHQLRFPEGMLYEDMPVTIPAHFLAKSVDVLDKTVYFWRVREGGDLSITQRRTELRAMRDRFRAVDSVSRFLADNDWSTAKRAYDRSVLRQDLRYFLNVLDVADDDFRETFIDLAHDYLSRADPNVEESLRALERIKWHLVREGALDELLEILAFESTHGAEGVRARSRRGHWYADYPLRRQLPRDLFRLDHDLEAVTRLTELRWQGAALHIAGAAYINFLGADSPRAQQVHLLVQDGDEPVTRVLAEPAPLAPGTLPDPSAPVSLDWASFRAVVPAASLLPSDRKSAIRIGIEVTAGDVSREDWRPAWARGWPARIAVTEVGDRRLRAQSAPSGELTVADVRDPAVVDGYDVGAAELTVHGLVDVDVDVDVAEESGLVLKRRLGGTELRYPAQIDRLDGKPDRFHARVPLAYLQSEVDVADRAANVGQRGDGVAWDFSIEVGSRRRRLRFDDRLDETIVPFDGREISVERSRYGYFSLVDRTPRPVVADAVWAEPWVLRLTGRFAGPAGDYEIVLSRRSAADQCRVPAVVDDDGAFVASIDVDNVDPMLGPAALPTGRWDLALRRAGDVEAAADMLVRHESLERLPALGVVGRRRCAFGVTGYDAPVLEIGPDLEDDERGARRRGQLERSSYRANRRRRLRDVVVYLCTDGRDYDDSPRAIHEELIRRGATVEHVWPVLDRQFRVPDTAHAVPVGSREFYAALATARFVVSNDVWPDFIERRRGQVFVQTWHGVPVKQEGLALANHRRATRDYRAALHQRADNWRLVLSGGPAATTALRRAFPFAGDVLETGLPRTDLLVDHDGVRRQQVRESLGLRPEQRVALYAPTFRDQLVQARSGYRLGDTLDLDALRHELGEEWTILFRRHHDVVGRLAPVGDPFVVDVTHHRSSLDCLLAADALVTDYSSLLVDQVATGRPLVLFAPDLAEYESARGLAIPLAEQAPVPLLDTTEAVIAALHDVAAGRWQPDARWEDFRARYCTHVDGGAAARVVERVFPTA
jgi:CDP-glycerol glycerophosphotransferase